MRLLNLVSVGAIAFLGLLDLVDLLDLVRRPADYHFGSEVAGFRYLDRGHFLGSIAVTIAIGLVGIAAPWLVRSRRAAVGVRLSAAVAMLVLSFALSSK